MSLNVKLLALAGAFAKAVSFLDVIVGRLGTAKIGMHDAENRAGGGEIGIELNGALQMREGVSLMEAIMEAVAEAEFLQGCQGRAGALSDSHATLPPPPE